MSALSNRLRKIEASLADDLDAYDDALLARCGITRDMAIARHGSVHEAFKAIAAEIERFQNLPGKRNELT